MLIFYLSIIETEEDQSLFQTIYMNYRHKMFKYAMSILHDEGNSEDVVHEVFLAIIRTGVEKIRNVENEGNLWAYLSTAIRNQSISFLKKQNNVQTVDAESNEYIDSLRTDGVHEQNSEYEYLVATIRSMNPTYADALYYSLVQEMPTDKIAKLLNIKPVAARKRISRGKEILRKKLGKDFFE